MPTTHDITRLLIEWQNGVPDAMNRLFPLVYDSLRQRAHHQIRKMRPGNTLNTTALVHEAYLKLVNQSQAKYNDRIHFFAVAATAMRHILINYAKQQNAKKRPGKWRRLTFEDVQLTPEGRADILLALDEAMVWLDKIAERLCRIVELRFFGGMTEKEIADFLGVSERTVRRDWQKARSLLTKFLQDKEPPTGSS